MAEKNGARDQIGGEKYCFWHTPNKPLYSLYPFFSFDTNWFKTRNRQLLLQNILWRNLKKHLICQREFFWVREHFTHSLQVTKRQLRSPVEKTVYHTYYTRNLWRENWRCWCCKWDWCNVKLLMFSSSFRKLLRPRFLKSLPSKKLFFEKKMLHRNNISPCRITFLWTFWKIKVRTTSFQEDPETKVETFGGFFFRFFDAVQMYGKCSNEAQVPTENFSSVTLERQTTHFWEFQKWFR